MYRLKFRLDAENPMQRILMLLHATLLGLPFVAEDLIEFMEFWEHTDTQAVRVALVTDNKEVYSV